MAFLTANDKIVWCALNIFINAVVLQMPKYVGDILEADQQIVNELCLEMPGNACDQVGSDLRLDHDGRTWQSALLRQLTQLEMSQECCNLMARDKAPPRSKPTGIMAPSRSASGSVDRTRSAP